MERVGEARFPHRVGAYVVYERDGDVRPLYVGVAATQSISDRWSRQHLYPRAGGSALRRSVAVHARLVVEKLRRPERYHTPEVEAAITGFLRGCYIDFYPTDSAAEAKAVESRLIRDLDPVLNVVRG